MSNNQQIIDAPSERTIRTRTVKYSGYVIETTVEEYELNENTVLTRDVVEMPGAVAVAVLNDSNELLMLNQYRHPVRMNLWEVPAGLLDIDGEDPLVAAQRELAEEADLQADTWNALTDYFSSPGATSEAGRVYLARNLSELPAEEHSERTDEEILTKLRALAPVGTGTGAGGRNASFAMPSGSLTARLLEGKFPNYNSVIPTSSVHNIIVDKDQLFFASKRVSLFSNRASSLVILDFADDSIRITGQDLDLSIAAEETISCSGQQAGTRLRIGFDFSYLQRLLQNVASEQIQFSLNDQTRAGVITPLTSDEGIDITALIIPMKLLGE